MNRPVAAERPQSPWIGKTVKLTPREAEARHLHPDRTYRVASVTRGLAGPPRLELCDETRRFTVTGVSLYAVDLQ